MFTSADKERPRLNLEDLLHLRWQLGGMLALLSVWTVFYLEAAVWPVGLLATVAIFLAMAFPALPLRASRRLWQLGMPAIAMFFAVDLYSQEMIPAFVRLTVLLVLYRAVAHRTRREDLQLLVLCLFLIVVTGVLTVSVAFAVQIVVFTSVAMTYLFVVNLVRDAQGEVDELPPPQWALVSRKRLLRRIQAGLDLRMFILGASLLVVVVGLAGMIFVAMPRLQMDGSLSLFKSKRDGAVTGFSETISLGEVTKLTQDHSVAMRVDVPAGTARPNVPYWRMVALDEYGSGSFRVSRAVQAAVSASRISTREFAPDWWREAGAAVMREGTAASSYTVYMEGGISRYLPLPGAFTRLRFREIEELVPNAFFGLVSTPQVSAGLVSYQIEGTDFGGRIPDAEFGRKTLRAPSGANEQVGDDKFRYRFLSYPGTTAAVPLDIEERAYLRTEVERITGGEVLDARSFAARACEYLARTHHYSTSVELPAAKHGADPVVRWMGSGLAGHCEFFASAFTLLMRTAGFPTRAITGFKGGAWNAFENYYMVRNSDAHAWCEVHDGAGSWFRVDPTPGGGGVDSMVGIEVALAAMTGDRSISAYVDSLRMIWYRRIVSFDERSQRKVVGALKTAGRKAVSGAWAFGGRTWERAAAWVARPWALQSRANLAYLAATVMLAAWGLGRSGARFSDFWGPWERGEAATRRRAGHLLRRLRLRLAEPLAGGRWDVTNARELEFKLCAIRYGQAQRWPDAITVFRAARRIL